MTAQTPDPIDRPQPDESPDTAHTAEDQAAPEGVDDQPEGEAEPQAEPPAAAEDQAAPEGVDDQPEGEAEPPAAAEDQAAPEAEAEPQAEPPAAAEDQAAPEGEAPPPAEPQPKKKKPKPQGPSPAEITKRIGTTAEDAIRYVLKPDPKLSRMARKHREAVIADLPPVTAGALLGPAALARHFIASAATGRYRDLFNLWIVFKERPEECKPVLAERQRALDSARRKLETSVRLGLTGDATRVADDIRAANGLPWKWLREILDPWLVAASARPAVAAALLVKEPGIAVELPADPSEQWLAEAARVRESGVELPAAIDDLLGAHADRLPATVGTLQMTHAQHPDRVPALIERIDLDAPDIAAMAAWARDHGHGDRLRERILAEVTELAERDRAAGLARWRTWQDRSIDVPLPEPLTRPTLEGLDLGRPETADLLKVLVDGGADFDPQQIVDDVAKENRMRGEKAFEAFVCAGFDVHLPLVLEGNPMVPKGSRCTACQAWTWVRPGHEARCPRLEWSIEDQAVSQHSPAEAADSPTTA